ncbi:MAG: amidohydrolase family protein [Steroidobacteraceae bacterium]|jgi:imidazolonepropionase-like amidohydrolase
MPLISFDNASLFDGIHPDVAQSMCVLVEGNEIKEVSERPIKSQAAERVDCSGKTLMPGLIDCHVHIYLESLNLQPPEPPITYRAQYAQKFLRHILSCGFTTVRDVAGGDHGMAMALRDGFLEGPRFYYGGLCLTQTGGHGDMRPMSQETDFITCGASRNVLAIHADGVDECIKATREELRKGASHIKIMGSGGIMSPNDPLDRSQYSEAEIRAVVEECTRHGAYVCAHCHPSEAIRRCVEYGVRSIEHGTLINEETAAFVAKRGAFVVPTLSVLFALFEDGSQMGMPEVSRRKLIKVHDYALKGLEIMKRAGVKMGFGTDLLGEQHTRQGTEFSIRREVLTPFDILHAATAVNAEILQMNGKLGVVQAGALADLLLVDGDPLQDVNLLAANGRHLTHIMLDGHWTKRS